MIRKNAIVINDFSGGIDTKTPITSMALNKSPNMRNWHCKGTGNRLIKRGGFSKVNSSSVESDGLDVFYPPGYQTTDYNLRDAAARTSISQGFKCNTSSTVTKVKLWLKKTGAPAGTDTVTLAIQTDSSGVPSGSAVTNGTATAVDISDTITTSYAWITFTFSTNPSLTAGTQYHLVLTGAFTVDAAACIQWGVDSYDVIYPDGTMSVNDGTTWTSDTLYNACFEVYITNGAKGNDGFATWDFSSKNMLLGIFGTSIYKMDKNSSGNPDGTWDSVGGGAAWDSYTKFISHFDGNDGATSATDEIGNTITFVGNAQLDTAQKKFGTASLLLDGTGDRLTVPDSVSWAFGTGDFTIRFNVRFNSLATASGFVGQDGTVAGNYWDFTLSSGGAIIFRAVENSVTLAYYSSANLSLSTNTWYHFELARNGSTIYFFLDGVSKTLTETTAIGSSAMPDIDNVLSIGAETEDGSYLNGWMDELRVDKGIARHTANFTPDTSAFSAGSMVLTSSRFWTMADWQSGRALVNTDIGLYTYIGTGNISAVSAAPIGKFLVIWKKYAFIFGIRGSPNNGRYSDLSDYTTWPAANTFSNAFDTSDGDVITAVRILKGKLYVFKRYSIFRITYLGSNPTFQVDQVSGYGTPSHYTVKEVDMSGDIGTVLISLTTDKKLAIFDGYNIQVVSDVLTEETNDLFASADDQPLSFSDMNFRYVDLFHAQVKIDTSEYILYAVLGSDTSVNYAFVFDYKTGGIFPYDGQIFASSCYALATNKVKKLYCSGYTGYTWLQEDGDDDDGTAINAYWVSGKIKANGIALLNKNLLLGINIKEITSVSAINIAFQYRFDWNVSWMTAQNFSYNHNDELAFGKTVLFDIGSIENMLQIKLKNNSSNPAPTIYGIELYGDSIPLGVSVQDRGTV